MTIRIFITGPFKVLGAGGEDFTPSGSKEQGLLALLATGDNGKRSRAWLRHMLWSRSDRKQAGGSLRQATTKLKKQLGAAQFVLGSNRLDMFLDLTAVEIVDEPDREFLEGLDARDDKFEEWHSKERLDRSLNLSSGKIIRFTEARPLKLTPPMCLQIRSESLAAIEYGWIEQSIADSLAKSLRENFSLPVVVNTPDLEGVENWIASISVMVPQGDELGVRIGLTDGDDVQQLWSGQCVIKERSLQLQDHPDIQRLSYQFGEGLADALVRNFGTQEQLLHPDLLCQLGIRRLFTMRADKIESADRLFAKAYDLHKSAVYLAWRAQLREIQFLERIRDDREALAAESEEFAAKAIELDPNNSMVLALIANTRLYVNGNIGDSFKLAMRSVALNPCNPMAWWALSAAEMKLGQFENAHEKAKTAARLMRNSSFEFWANSQLSGTSIALGQLDEAKRLLMSVSLDRPNFRPALRYLFALHAKDEEWNSAISTAARLSEVEPGFSIEQLLTDENYPVRLVREMGGLDAPAILEATADASRRLNS